MLTPLDGDESVSDLYAFEHTCKRSFGSQKLKKVAEVSLSVVGAEQHVPILS